MDRKKSQGFLVSPESAEKDGYDRGLIEVAGDKHRLIRYSGDDISLTEKGYNKLLQYRISEASTDLSGTINDLNKLMSDFSGTSKELDKKMIKHTKRLNKLTIALLIAAVFTLIATIISIIL